MRLLLRRCSSLCARGFLRRWLCSCALNLNVRDLHRVLRTAIVACARCSTTRHTGDFLHQLHAGFVALAKDGIAAVRWAASAHASIRIQAGIEEGNFLLCDKKL